MIHHNRPRVHTLNAASLEARLPTRHQSACTGRARSGHSPATAPHRCLTPSPAPSYAGHTGERTPLERNRLGTQTAHQLTEPPSQSSTGHTVTDHCGSARISRRQDSNPAADVPVNNPRSLFFLSAHATVLPLAQTHFYTAYATWEIEAGASTSADIYSRLALLASESVQQPCSNPSKSPELLGKAS